MRTRVIWAGALAVVVLASGCAASTDEPTGRTDEPTPTVVETDEPGTGTPDASDDVLDDEVLEGPGASVRLPQGWAYREDISVPGMFVQAGPEVLGEGIGGSLAVLDPIPVSGGLDGAARSQIESSLNTKFRRVDDVTLGEHTFYRLVAGRGTERREIQGTVVDGIEHAVQFNLQRAGGPARAEADAMIAAVMGSWTLT